jgi:hypothetical protein
MKRPKCEFPGCNNEGLVMFYGKLICGECLVKIQKIKEKKKWEEIINATN